MCIAFFSCTTCRAMMSLSALAALFLLVGSKFLFFATKTVQILSMFSLLVGNELFKSRLCRVCSPFGGSQRFFFFREGCIRRCMLDIFSKLSAGLF